jgi:hypothetical protein
MILGLFRFGFVLMEQIAALGPRTQDLLEDEDLESVHMLQEYVEIKNIWLESVRWSYPCIQPVLSRHSTRHLDSFPANGFFTDAAEQLEINLSGTSYS